MLDHMNAPTIFYSWQSDTKSAWNKSFIESCLQEAVVKIAQRTGFENGIIVQRDTTGAAGTPPIPDTIFDRIDRCAVFVGDVSFVGRALGDTQAEQPEPAETQMFPNANVILELGYAVKTIGWERVICVMNTAYGKPDDHIFHFLQHRFPATYLLKEQAQEDSARRKLVEKLSEYVEIALRERHAAATRTTQQFNADCFLLVRVLKGVDFFSHDTFNQAPEDLRPKLREVFPRTVDRLLDLGVIYTDFNAGAGTYAYHWTYLGELVKALV